MSGVGIALRGFGKAFKAKKVGGGKKPSKKDLTDFLDKNVKKTSDIKKDKIGENVEQTMKEVAFVGAPAVAITQTIREKNKKARNTKPSPFVKRRKNLRSPKKSK